MAKTRSITRNQNHVETPTKKRSMRTIDKGYSSPWSDLNHDVLFLLMMQLGVVEFLAFSGVCKSWRAVARSNKETFMASRQPMLIWISDRRYKKECFLKDSEGRKYKTLLPHSGGRECVGITCGYLVLFQRKTLDFWLVNPITRNELHFPAFPYASYVSPFSLRAILVFSPIISKVVLVMVDGDKHEVLFSIAGMGSWSHVSCTFVPRDLLVFKGKIYVIDKTRNRSCLYEVRLHLEPKLVLLLETKEVMSSNTAFFSCGENLYVVESNRSHSKLFDFHELDFGQKEWVHCKRIKGEYAFFMQSLSKRRTTAIKPEWWAEPQPQYRVGSCNYAVDNIYERGMDRMWYFPHECLNATLIDG